MINQVSQINPYLLILSSLKPLRDPQKPREFKSAGRMEKESSGNILKILCIHKDGVYTKALKSFIGLTGLSVYGIDETVKALIDKNEVEQLKDKYAICDRARQAELYRELGAAGRRAMHNFYGKALAECFRYQKSKCPEIACLALKAGNMPRAKEYLEQAGDYQKEVYKNTDALRSYKKYNELLDENEKEKKLDVMIKMLEIMYTTGKWDEFNAMYEEAERTAKKIGDKESRAKVLNLRGSVCFFQGEVDKAIKTFRKAENLMLGNVSSYTYAETMRFLGRSFLQMGKNDKAEMFFNKTFKIGERLENDELKAKALENIGRVYRLKSEYEKAVEYYERALVLYKKLQNLKGVSDTLEKLGVANFYMGKNDEALKIFKSANRVNSSLNYIIGICNNLGNIGTVYFAGEKLRIAEKYFRSQVKYAKKIKNKDVIAKALGYIGLVNEGVGNLNQSLKCYKEQLNIYEYLGNQNGISNSLSNVALIYSYLGNMDKAILLSKEQICIDIKIKNPQGIARGFNNLGSYYLNIERYYEAIKYFKKSIKFALNYNLKILHSASLFNTSECYYYLKKDHLAKKFNKIGLNLPYFKTKYQIAYLKIQASFEGNSEFYIKKIEDFCISKTDDELNAEKYYALWEISNNAPKYRKKAIFYYSTLYNRFKKSQYKNKILKLKKYNYVKSASDNYKC